MSKSFQIRVSSVPKSQTSPAHSAIFCSSCQFGLAQVFGTTRPRAGVALALDAALEAAFALALEPAFALAPDGKMMENWKTEQRLIVLKMAGQFLERKTTRFSRKGERQAKNKT